jgi:hypothetical protein
MVGWYHWLRPGEPNNFKCLRQIARNIIKRETAGGTTKLPDVLTIDRDAGTTGEGFQSERLAKARQRMKSDPDYEERLYFAAVDASERIIAAYRR